MMSRVYACYSGIGYVLDISAPPDLAARRPRVARNGVNRNARSSDSSVLFKIINSTVSRYVKTQNRRVLAIKSQFLKLKKVTSFV